VFLDLQGSLPWDGKDKGKVPDDGWMVRAGLANVASEPMVVTAYAICLKKK